MGAATQLNASNSSFQNNAVPGCFTHHTQCVCLCWRVGRLEKTVMSVWSAQQLLVSLRKHLSCDEGWSVKGTIVHLASKL